MITQSQFYPLLGSMSQPERDQYLSDLQQWIQDELPLVDTASEWNASDIERFDNGLRFLTVIIATREFCLNAYNLPTDKCVKYFVGHMESLIRRLRSSGCLEDSKAGGSATRDTNVIGKMSASSVNALQVQMAVLQKKGKCGRPPKEDVPEIPVAALHDAPPMSSSDGVTPLSATYMERRPQQVKEYIHYLPDDIQALAVEYIFSDNSLYLQIAELSNRLDALCRDPKSFKGDRAILATKICHLEEKLNLIYRKIDAAYAEAEIPGKQRQMVSEDYKLFLEKETIRIEGALRERTPGEYTKFEIDEMPDGEEKETAKAARIDRNKKHLRRTDRKVEGEVDEHFRKSLEEAARELVEWGILITDTQADNCARFGYDVPSDWRVPSPEEKKRQQMNARNVRAREKRVKQKAERDATRRASSDSAAAPYTQEGLSIYR